MKERRSLTEGLKATPAPIDPGLEKQFVFGPKSSANAKPEPSAATNATSTLRRSPISTRMRSDYATALKRASLERQLQGVEPYTLTDILEQAVEPWLKANGYIE